MEFIGRRQLELFLAYQNDMCIAMLESRKGQST